MKNTASEMVKKQAKRAAWADLRDGRDGTDAMGRWWVAELSYELGIVDARGMIDVNGETAQAFVREYKRIYKRDR